MLPLAHAVCLLALSFSSRHVLFVVFTELIAPCYTVFAVDARRQHARTYFKNVHIKSKALETKAVVKRMTKRMFYPASDKRRRRRYHREAKDVPIEPAQERERQTSENIYLLSVQFSLSKVFSANNFQTRRDARHAKHTRDHQGWANIFCCSSFFSRPL